MGVSSLLKSAAATRKRIASQEDAVAAFEWENSAQTYDDFVDYQQYLDKRRSAATDVSDIIGYETKLRSARRSYTSNEIQRRQIDILQGRANTQDKIDAVVDLYYQAIDNDDLNLAQNLMSQYSTLNIQLQNEAEQSAKAFAAAGSKAFDKLVNDLTKGVDMVTLPNGTQVPSLSMLARDMEQTGGSDLTWKDATDTLEALREVIIDKYNNATSQEQIDKLEEKYGAGLQNIDEVLTFNVGGKKLSFQDVVNASAQEGYNNPLFSLQATYDEATGETKYKLKENKIEKTDFVRQYDENGQEVYVPLQIRSTQNSNRISLDTQITDEGNIIGDEIKGTDGLGIARAGSMSTPRDEAFSIKNRLNQLGIEVREADGRIMVKLPGQNVERAATIQPDGSIRYFDDNGQLAEVGLIDRNLGTEAAPALSRAGETRLVSPDEISDFGTQSAFGGTLSKASRRGERYLSDITGRSVVDAARGPISGPIRVGNDFSGFGTAVTSGLLQGAGAVRQQIQKEQEQKAMLQAQAEAATRLQASQTFNLNQVPVQQFAANGVLKRQLQVSAPTAAPRVYVAPPTAPTKIGSTSTAQPKGKVTIGVAAAKPRLVVR